MNRINSEDLVEIGSDKHVALIDRRIQEAMANLEQHEAAMHALMAARAEEQCFRGNRIKADIEFGLDPELCRVFNMGTRAHGPSDEEVEAYAEYELELECWKETAKVLALYELTVDRLSMLDAEEGQPEEKPMYRVYLDALREEAASELETANMTREALIENYGLNIPAPGRQAVVPAI